MAFELINPCEFAKSHKLPERGQTRRRINSYLFTTGKPLIVPFKSSALKVNASLVSSSLLSYKLLRSFEYDIVKNEYTKEHRMNTVSRLLIPWPVYLTHYCQDFSYRNEPAYGGHVEIFGAPSNTGSEQANVINHINLPFLEDSV